MDNITHNSSNINSADLYMSLSKHYHPLLFDSHPNLGPLSLPPLPPFLLPSSMSPPLAAASCTPPPPPSWLSILRRLPYFFHNSIITIGSTTSALTMPPIPTSTVGTTSTTSATRSGSAITRRRRCTCHHSEEEERGPSRGEEGFVVAERSRVGLGSAPDREEDEAEHVVRDGTVARMTEGAGSSVASQETSTPCFFLGLAPDVRIAYWSLALGPS